MTETAAYEIGFRKTAESHGVNPDFLRKIAEDNGFTSKIVDYFRNMDPAVRNSLVSAIAGTALSYPFMEGTHGNRFMKSLGVGGVGGLTAYGLSRLMKDKEVKLDKASIEETIDSGLTRFKNKTKKAKIDKPITGAVSGLQNGLSWINDRINNLRSDVE